MDEHQAYERDWWGDCLNTFSEEAKQITYAHRMGLVNTPTNARWPVYDLGGRSVLDLGGGPSSLLLKCVNRGRCAVVDPCPYPAWTRRRYAHAGITLFEQPAENYLSRQGFDEVWIYNVLQHVENPEQVIACAHQHGDRLRIFEWIDIPPTLGHPHMLTKDLLDEWIGGDGQVAHVDENSAVGLAYFGDFSL